MLYYIINNFDLFLYCVGSFSAFPVPTWEDNKASWEAVCLESGVVIALQPYFRVNRRGSGCPVEALQARVQSAPWHVSPHRQVTWLY